MKPPALPIDDRLLTMREVGQRLHMGRYEAKCLVESDPILRTGLRFRGEKRTTAYCTQSAVVRYIAWGVATTPQAEPAKPPARRTA